MEESKEKSGRDMKDSRKISRYLDEIDKEARIYSVPHSVDIEFYRRLHKLAEKEQTKKRAPLSRKWRFFIKKPLNHPFKDQ